MNEIDNNEKQHSPHDEFFRNVFADVAIARDFLENYLPAPILKIVELENLEIQPGTYVDKKLKKFSTDMLFKTTINKREGYVYFLFEHKSYPDRLVALQLLTYMVQIWNQKVNRENATHIPMIIPMVIYHGKSKWNIGTLEDLILDFDLLPEEAKQMIPDYHYQVYDLSRYSDEEIKGHAKLRIMISILKAVFGNSDADALQTIVKAGAALAELEESEKGIEYFEVCLRYILDSRLDFSTEQLNIIIRELNDSYKDVIQQIIRFKFHHYQSK